MRLCNKKMRTYPASGFTLVEMSVVVVIIGLLLAGIVKGMDMMEKARLDSAIASLQKYKMAAKDFQAKYNYLPGDAINTDRYWTSAQCPDSGANTCSGNGDGKILRTGGNEEGLRAWQHLALAGLIAGSYTGQRGGANTSGVVLDPNSASVNIPASEVTYRGTGGTAGVGGFWFYYSSTSPYLGNFILFGRDPISTLTDNVLGGIISPKNAAGVDRKMDDGMAQTGKVFGVHSPIGDGGCLTANNYTPGGNTQSCVLWFNID